VSLNISRRCDVLSRLLKRLTVQKNIADQTTRVFKAWGNT
jgi:hypothetical protein